MTTLSIQGAMPELPHPGQKVRWRDPSHALAWGWEAIHGPGPFEVVRVVDKGGSSADLVLRTALGEQGINEVWLALAKEPETGPKESGKPSECASGSICNDGAVNSSAGASPKLSAT